jgi:tetratricopeptide (TPR) repeat protein
MSPEAGEPRPLPAMTRHHLVRVVGVFVCGVAVLVVGVAVLTARWRQVGGEAELRELARKRILLARISIDDRWSPCAPPPGAAVSYCRAPEEVSRSLEPRQLAAVVRGGKDVERRPALARLLLEPGGDRLERILSQLEAVAMKEPRAADPLVDLAAAQLTAGWTRGSAASFVDALESADQASKLEPGNARACFNRAFAFEELGLLELAAEGWSRCAGLEEDPQWSAEARQRAAVLDVPPVQPSREKAAILLGEAVQSGRWDELGRWARDRPHLAADLVVRDLLPRWVEAGPIRGAAWWPGLEQLAEGLRRSTGDLLLSDIAHQMRAGVARGRGEEIVKGIRQMRSGLDHYRNREYGDAAIGLRASAAGLRAVPALRLVARVYGAVSLHSSGHIEAAAEEMSQIVAQAGERGYPWPLGYAHWTLGRMAMKSGRPLGALGHFRQALRAFESIRAEDLALSIRIMLAETYSEMGQAEQAWQFARGALLAAQRIGASDQLFFVFNLFAGIADELGRPRLALYAETSAIEHAAGKHPRLRANAHLWRAYLLDRQGLGDSAQDLRRAEALVREVGDLAERAKLQAEVDLVRGALAAHTDPEAAAVWLKDAANLFEETKERVGQLVALKARADALRKMGRVEEAVEDLETAMAAYDLTARGLAEGQEGHLSELERLSFLRQNANIYQTMIDLHVRELASPWKALVYAEHAKSLGAPGRPPELDLPEDAANRWSRALPQDTALLSYSTAGERIVAWVLTPSGRWFRPLARSTEVLALIDRLHRAPDAAAWEGLSRELYLHLLAPLAEPLRRMQRILIVPSPGLDRVPFAGLLDPRSGRYLAETHLLEMLPCAPALLQEDDPPGAAVARRRSLVVGDPRPSNAGLLRLAPLRHAEQEAREAAAALGSETTLLLGPEATPGRFREQAPGAETIHVAGHALALGRGAGSAALVLATGDGDEEGLLTAQEVLDLPLSGTRLVVLSACSSAGGPAVSWQSGLTLARSFLSAGAERVIATLRAVDDEESASLFRAFYRELTTGKDAAASLRSAQQEVLLARSRAGSPAPPSWPYVIILGSRPSQ